MLKEQFHLRHSQLEKKVILPEQLPNGKIKKRIIFRSPLEANEQASEKPKMTLDALVEKMSNKTLVWEEIPKELISQVVTYAAKEIGEDKDIELPPSLLTQAELGNTKFKFLKGNKLRGLYNYYAKKRAGRETFAVMFEDVGIKPTVDDITTANRLGREILWERFYGEAIHDTLAKAAGEIGKTKNIELPVSLLEKKELTDTKFTFLEGKTLNGLWEHFIKRNKEDNTMIAIFKNAGVEPTIADIKAARLLGRKLYWERFSNETIRELLIVAASHLKKPKPASFLTDKDLKQDFNFIDGNLESLLSYARRIMPDKEKTPVKFLCNKVGINLTSKDLISMIAAKEQIRWDRINDEALYGVLQKAVEETKIPLFIWQREADFQHKYKFLDGQNLYNLYQKLWKSKGKEDVIIFLLDKLDMKVTAHDIVTTINSHPVNWDIVPQQRKEKLYKEANMITTFPEVLTALEGNDSFWGRVHPNILQELIEKASVELEILPPMLSKELLAQSFKFLNGHSLISLFDHVKAVTPIKKKENRSTPQPDIINEILKQANVIVDKSRQPESKKSMIVPRESSLLERETMILTREQEQTLFRYLNYGISLDWLRQDQYFLNTFGRDQDQKRQKIEQILSQSNTIKDVLILSNIKLVMKIANNYPTGRLSLQEKIDAGINGLMYAIDKTTGEQGYAFAGYAKWQITSFIQKHIAERGYIFPVPVNLIDRIGTLLQLEEAFQSLFNRRPTITELRQQAITNTDLPLFLIHQLLDFHLFTKISNPHSINELFEDSLKEKEKYQLIYVNKFVKEVAEQVENKEDNALIRKKLNSLSSNEQIVIKAFCGFDEEPLSLEQIATKTNKKLSYVTKILKGGLKKLRAEPEMQQFQQDRVSPTTNQVTLFDPRIKAIEEAGLFQITTEQCLKIINLREREGLTYAAIAEQLNLSLVKIDTIIHTLIQQRLIKRLYPRVTSYLLAQGILSEKEIEERKKVSDRTIYTSDETEKVKRYLEQHPQRSRKDRIYGFIKGYTKANYP